MNTGHLLAFNVALLAAILSPGPALLVAIRTTLSAGRSAGIAVGAGLGIMASTWTLLALVGMDAVFALFPWAYGLAKTAGAIYLLYLAYRMWAGAQQAVEAPARAATRAFRDGFMINLLNPKSVLFAAAVLVVVFPENMSPFDKAIVVANHLFVELLFYGLLACLMSSSAISRRYLAAKFWLDRAAAVVLGSLGVRLLTSRWQD